MNKIFEIPDTAKIYEKSMQKIKAESDLNRKDIEIIELILDDYEQKKIVCKTETDKELKEKKINLLNQLLDKYIRI